MGVVTHFANAEPTHGQEQPATVSIQLNRMGKIQPMPKNLCMANSAATLWQSDGGQLGRSRTLGANIPVNDVAKRCGTIGYELMCAIALRVPMLEDEN